MKLNHKLVKELGIGVISLALITPLVLNRMQSSPVHAESMAQLYRVYNKEQSSVPKSEIRQRERLIARGDASEQHYEQNLIKRDPSAAGMYADEPDNNAKTKAIIREAVIKYPQDQDEAMLKRYHVKYRRNRAKKHGTHRSNHRRANKRHVARKHRSRRAKSYGNADQFTSSLKKHDKNYRNAESHEGYEQNRDAIDEMPSNPSVVYDTIYDAKNGHHVNKTVLAKAKYWEHRDKANGAWYSPNGKPNKCYAWGRNLKHGHRNHAKKHVTRHHHTRKRTNKKHNHHKSRKATNKDR